MFWRLFDCLYTINGSAILGKMLRPPTRYRHEIDRFTVQTALQIIGQRTVLARPRSLGRGGPAPPAPALWNNRRIFESRLKSPAVCHVPGAFTFSGGQAGGCSDWATPAGPRDGNKGASFLYPLDPLVAHGRPWQHPGSSPLPWHGRRDSRRPWACLRRLGQPMSSSPWYRTRYRGSDAARWGRQNVTVTATARAPGSAGLPSQLRAI
jgi:hypothetical protein